MLDEFGPFSIKMHGGRSLMKYGELKTVPQWQRSKGSLILTAALELSTNQVTHFYSKKKDTGEMIKLLEILLDEYSGESCIYLSWDAASWHVYFPRKTGHGKRLGLLTHFGLLCKQKVSSFACREALSY